MHQVGVYGNLVVGHPLDPPVGFVSTTQPLPGGGWPFLVPRPLRLSFLHQLTGRYSRRPVSRSRDLGICFLEELRPERASHVQTRTVHVKLRRTQPTLMSARGWGFDSNEGAQGRTRPLTLRTFSKHSRSNLYGRAPSNRGVFTLADMAASARSIPARVPGPARIGGVAAMERGDEHSTCGLKS